MKWELASADGKAEEVADFAALQATVAEHVSQATVATIGMPSPRQLVPHHHK